MCATTLALLKLQPNNGHRAVLVLNVESVSVLSDCEQVFRFARVVFELSSQLEHVSIQRS